MNKLLNATRGIFITAFLLLVAGLLNTKSVQSAYPNAPADITLTVIKNVINDNGGNLNNEDFSFSVNGGLPISFNQNGTNILILPPGTYNVVETAVAGYSTTYDNCSNLEIPDGGSATCTITNDDYARLTLVKDPTNDNGGTAEPDEFLLTVGGSPVLSGVTTNYPVNIPMAINETQLVGYTFIGITDDTSGKCPSALGDPITLAFGDDITCTIVNDDIPAIKAVPAADLVTVEDGTTDTFTVVLTTIPSNNVTITVSSSDPTEGTVSPGVLPFTPLDWNVPQEVTVTGVDDLVADLDIVYNVVLNPTGSAAAEYNSLAPVQINALNYDDDTAGYIVSPTENLNTTEGEGAQKVTISLRSRPTGPVSLSFIISDPSEGKASPTSLIIDPTTWPQPPAEVTVTGVDDCLNDGNILYSLTINALSTDSNYTGQVGILPITNYDAPTITWAKPVGDEDIYYLENLTPVLLEIDKVCNEPISKVRFYRWVASASDWVTIGEDLTPPYQETIVPLELEFGWNEIRAFAFGPVPPPGGIQTYSKHPYILIRKDFGGELRFLPVIRYKP